MSKSEVYSWRLSSELKRKLEEAASAENASIGAILERVVGEWLRTRQPSEEEDAEEQRRLHKRARRAIGAVSVAMPSPTNAEVRKVIAEYLEEKLRASQHRAPRRSD